MYYVKTVYAPDHCRLPDISEYETEEEAATFISNCLKWGIGILMCELVDKAVAKYLLQQGKAETDGRTTWKYLSMSLKSSYEPIQM